MGAYCEISAVRQESTTKRNSSLSSPSLSTTTTLSKGPTTIWTETSKPTKATSGSIDVTSTGPSVVTTQPSTHILTSPKTTNTLSTITNGGGFCQNGGFYNGGYCVCRELLFGNTCEFIVNQVIPDKVIVKLEVTVYIVNEDFTNALLDKNTNTYQSFTTRFIQQMTNYYITRISYFEEVSILSISKGSIRVDHEVYLRVDSKHIAEQQAEAAAIIQKALRESNCTTDTLFAGILCFNTSRAAVIQQVIDISGLCSTSDVIPEEFRQYFYGVIIPPSDFLCVSNCSQANQYVLNCNHGQCLVNKKGPSCYCQTSNQYWYTGFHCQTAISKPGVYGGVAAGLAVLLLLFLLLLFLLCRRRLSDKHRLIDTDEYSSPASLYSVKNDSLQSSLPGVHGPGSGENFHPSLGNVDPHLKMAVPRPQVAN
ncbi:mucin-17-like [Hyperolius riggenbachi]|uniref:mucin-17-like n=1 Tax=Hyperolius riggenbachi TaxID=752182 RepID=UPI0035A3B3E3